MNRIVAANFFVYYVGSMFNPKKLDPVLLFTAAVIKEKLEAKGIEVQLEHVKPHTPLAFQASVSSSSSILVGIVGITRKGGVVYNIFNNGMYNWGMQEGYTDDQLDEMDVLYKELETVDCFVNFLSGSKNYRVKGKNTRNSRRKNV